MSRFDVAIMNPPYSRSLHLEFLSKTIKISDTVISLQPVRWLQDPVAYMKKTSAYNKYYNDIVRHIKEVFTLDNMYVHDIFNISLNTYIGIYACSERHNEGCKLPVRINKNILDKILSAPQKINDVIQHNRIDGIRWHAVYIQPMLAQGGEKYTYGWFCNFCIYNHLRSLIYKDGYDKTGRFWTEINSGIKKPKGSPFIMSIPFETEKEAVNFENSLKTTFYHYLVYGIKADQHTPYKYLPFMGDYTHAWTNERFYEYFKLTADEIHDIEDMMKDFENDMNAFLKKRDLI